MSSTFGSFDGLPLISAAGALQAFQKLNRDPAPFLNKANSYRCPIGEEHGTGWLLMRRGDVKQIDTSAFKTLVLGAGNTSVTFPGLIFKEARRILPGTSLDDDALYLVEVVDKRWLAKQSFINARYNLRQPHSAADEYLSQTENSGSPWTWAQVVQDVWGKNNTSIIGTYSSQLPTTTPALASTPENLKFNCVSAWSALCDTCRRIGCEVRYDPIANTFGIVQMGNGTADNSTNLIDLEDSGGIGSNWGLMAADATSRSSGDMLVHDDEVFTGNYAYPASVRVCFRGEWDESDAIDEINTYEYGPFYAIEVTGSGLVIGADYTTPASGAYAGTTEILFDSMRARFPNAVGHSPTNLTALTVRAKEVAQDFYRTVVDNQHAHLVCSGPNRFTPGPFVGEVVWRDYGDGLKTEVYRYRPKIGKMEHDEDHWEKWNLIRGTLGGSLTETTTTTLNCQAWVNSGGSPTFASTGRVVSNVRFGLRATGVTLVSGTVVWCVRFCGQYFVIAAECRASVEV